MRDSAHRVAARIVKKLDIDHVQNKADWKVLSGKKKKSFRQLDREKCTFL